MPTAQPRVDLSDRTTRDVEYRIAASREERASAFRLVYSSYLKAGLGAPNQHEMRVTPYHLLPTSEVFIATLDGQTIFTVSLMIDGGLGLPMEVTYGDEVELRRQQGLVLGEVSCLADRRRQFRGFFPVFLRLCRLMVQYARRQGLDELLVAIHPKHAKFYRRYMDFRVIGQQKAYPTVCNHPAVALSLNFDRIDRERPSSYETFFGEALPEEELRPQPIQWEDREYFGAMVDPTFTLAPVGNADGLSRGSTAAPAVSVP